MSKKFDNAALLGFYYMQISSPIRTGNLRYNALKFTDEGDKYVIEVDQQIAPYMKYTNENWDNFHPPLYGKQNPNEEWWNKAATDLVYILAHELGGKVTQE